MASRANGATRGAVLARAAGGRPQPGAGLPPRGDEGADQTAPGAPTVVLTEPQLQELLSKAVAAAVDKIEANSSGSMATISRGRGRVSVSSSSKPQEMGVPDSSDGKVYTGALKLNILRYAAMIPATHLPLCANKSHSLHETRAV